MVEQLTLQPVGLTSTQFKRLSEYAHESSLLPPAALLEKARAHLREAAAAYRRNRLVNLRLATAIGETIGDVIGEWDALPEVARPWLAAAILYFSSHQDEEPDFTSPIGFEDDLEVLNACLRFARREELCLRPEDYDDV